MPGARDMARPLVPKARKRVFKRHGPVSQTEKEFVAQYVQDLPAPVTNAQTNALARTMRRSKEAVKTMIEEAKENFQSNAEFYVNAHKQAITSALADGDPKALDAAIRGSQWAMENLGAEGVSIVNKKQQDTGSGAGKVLIGIKIGGMRADSPATVVEATQIP